MHHIGLGRALAGTPVIVLVADLDIRVIHAHTGEILRTLTLDPTATTNPKNDRRPNPTRGFRPCRCPAT